MKGDNTQFAELTVLELTKIILHKIVTSWLIVSHRCIQTLRKSTMCLGRKRDFIVFFGLFSLCVLLSTVKYDLTSLNQLDSARAKEILLDRTKLLEEKKILLNERAKLHQKNTKLKLDNAALNKKLLTAWKKINKTGTNYKTYVENPQELSKCLTLDGAKAKQEKLLPMFRRRQDPRHLAFMRNMNKGSELANLTGDSCMPVNEPRLYLKHGGGRLGNKLFHFATAIAIARKNNFTLYVPYDSEILRIFNITTYQTYSDIDYYYFAEGKFIQKLFHLGYNASFMNLGKQHALLHGGGVQTHRYFTEYGYQQFIREHYHFNSYITEQTDIFMTSLKHRYGRVANVTYVGIHVRRGDRAYDPEAVNLGYRPAPLSYFLQAINSTSIKYQAPIVYVVATDDPMWTKKFLYTLRPGTYIVHTPWGLNPEYDMAVMSRMDHMILSTGSFGWWCGFISGGDVIYYSKPFLPQTEQFKHWKKIYHNDMYPSYWTPMGDNTTDAAALSSFLGIPMNNRNQINANHMP